MQFIITAVEQIIKFINMIIDSVVSAITVTAQFVIIVIRGSIFLSTTITYLPAFLFPFATATIGIMVALFLINRKGG